MKQILNFQLDLLVQYYILILKFLEYLVFCICLLVNYLYFSVEKISGVFYKGGSMGSLLCNSESKV